MAKVELTDITSLQNETTALAAMAANNAAIEDGFNDSLSRSGKSPNAMDASIDMNGNRILNLPVPSSPEEPVRKAEFDAISGINDLTALLGYVSDAQESADAASTSATLAAASAVDAANAAASVAQGSVPDNGVTTSKVANGAVTNSKLADVATRILKGRNTAGVGAPEDLSLSTVLDWISSSVGNILMRGVSGWTNMAPGAAGSVLTSAGAGAQLVWSTPVSVPTGTVSLWASTRVPSGYLECDGTAVSRSTYSALYGLLVVSSTVTMTIALPGVVTWTNHQLKANDVIKFATSGALPTGITAGTTYYVVGAGMTADTFRISATPGGTAINTSGSQSGVHTAVHAPWGDGDGSTTFNLPDLRGEFVRGWDHDKGTDLNRTFGANQAQDVQPHTHPYYTINNRNTSSGSTEAIVYYSTVGNRTGLPNTGTETRPRNVSLMYIIKT